MTNQERVEAETIRNAIDKVEQGCAALGHLAESLEGLARRSTTPAAGKDAVLRVLRQIVAHERELDDPDGPLTVLVQNGPGLHSHIKLLQTDHGALANLARRLIEDSRNEVSEDRWADDLKRLLERIVEHQAATRAVLSKAKAGLEDPGL
jgi:hypothetical protein